jgi:hypothetical protein
MSELFGGKMVFPIHNTGHGAPFDEGMSLRDYIAIQAMQALVTEKDDQGSYWLPENVAELAYTQADAMLNARNGGE